MTGRAAGAVLLAMVGTACGSTGDAAEPPVDVGRVTCSETASSVTPSVRAQRDGVHLHVDVRGAVSVTLMGSDGGPGGVEGDIVHPFPPGAVRVQCYRTATDSGMESSFEVVDDRGVWVSTTLACASVSETIPEYAGSPKDARDHVAQTKENFGDVLRPDDRVERAGYPDAAYPQTRIVRDGEVLAVQTFRPSGVVESTKSCDRLDRQP